VFPERLSKSGDPLADVLRAAIGDQHAAEELVRATQGDVWRLCRALVDEESAEDIAQEAFIRVLRSLRSFRGESSVRVWVLAIARRTAMDHLRRVHRQRALTSLLRAQPRPVASYLQSTAEPQALLALLPLPLRSAFVLTQLLGLDYAETASVMGCPVGTIKSRVSRARTILAAAVSD
jgi:RNA polymerase sigma-70 factor (ECF subfamily)